MQNRSSYFTFLFVITLLLCFNPKSYSQCTWTQVEFDDFEGTNSPPFVNTTPIYGNGAHSAGSFNGALGLWLNIQNPIAIGFAGQVLYNRPFTVCPGQNYRFQAWIGGTNGSDFTTDIYDGANINGIPIATYNSFNGWVFQTIGAFIPTSSTITMVVRNNLPGSGGGNDFRMDDLALQLCVPDSLDNEINLCLNPGQISLHDSLVTAMSSNGSWSGPSVLTGGYLGSFDPLIMVPGTYTYTISGVGVCPDSINSVSPTLNIPDLTTTNDTVCAPLGANITTSFVDNNATGGTVTYWQDALATIAEPNPTNIITSGTYYIVMNTSGCSDTASINVFIKPLPNVVAGPSQTICAGDQVTLTGSGATTLTWSNSVINAVPFSPTTTTLYTLVGTTNGCVNTDTVTVIINPLPIVDAGIPQVICEGNQVILNGSGATNYSWDNGVQNGVSFTPTSTTTYTIIGTDGNNCADTAQVTVTVNPNPFADIQPSDLLGSAPLIVTFNNGSTSNNNYIWNFDNGDTSSLFLPPNISYENTGTYNVTLYVTDPITGCSSSDQVTIVVRAELAVIIPTIFTPNGDGINDIFNAVLENSESYFMSILNRWGTLVFETNTIDIGWDGKKNGKEVSEGSYFYIIEYSFYKQGILTSETVKGTISLLK